MSRLHVWAIVRLLPNMQRVVINRFRRRGDAENYLHILRRYAYEASLMIVFDPPSSAINPTVHLSNCEKLEIPSSSSRISARD